MTLTGHPVIAMAFSTLILLAGCGRGNGDGSAAPPASPWKIPDQYSGLIGDYRKDWTGLTNLEYSGLHWKQNIAIYVNKDSERYVQNYLEYVRVYVERDIDEEEAGKNGFEPYSPGTIFLKENYLPQETRPGKAMTMTAMIKREKGYDPAANDWQFIQWDPEGRVLLDGNSGNAPTQAMCIKCHANMAERDFVFSTFCKLAPAPQKRVGSGSPGF